MEIKEKKLLAKNLIFERTAIENKCADIEFAI